MFYTYSITHIDSGVHYYGVRYAKKAHVDDLGVTYFSSSKFLKRIIKNEGIDKFKFKIRKIFGSKEKAILHEHKFLSKVDAINSPRWFNKHNGNLIGKPRIKGFKYTEYTKQRMRKPKSEEHKLKLAKHLDNVRSNKWSEERKKKHSENMKGNTNGFIKGHDSWNKGRVKENDSKLMRLSETLKGKPQNHGPRTLKLVTCPHCGKSGKGGNMTRYHFDNCKSP